MSDFIFTIRDLEQTRRQVRYRQQRRRAETEARDYLVTFAFIAVCWLMRYLFTH